MPPAAQRLILASRSPRRRELLSALGVPLEVRPAETDESLRPGERPRAYVARVAREKARAVSGPVVLAADTAVVLGERVLGKPHDALDAGRMLRDLSGARHQVLTAVCVRRNEPGPALEREVLVATEVRFRTLTERQIRWYVETGEPLDKAGAYALQGAGGALVDGVDGSVSCVVGLPMAEALHLLEEVGFPLPWSGG
ncbi:MAG TPA: Maf family protein [Anaeromyxobacter sp.]|nr:Maf family protein [Anaeromyxobacter sp.]